MSDIKQKLKVHLMIDRQISTKFKQIIPNQPYLIQEQQQKLNIDHIIMNQKQSPNKNKLLKINKNNITKQNNKLEYVQILQNINDNSSPNKTLLPIIQENQEQEKIITVQDNKDIFQEILDEERKQEGSIVIKFGKEIQIQPKFMKIRGTMCWTELWSNKQKKELCQEYIREQKIEKGVEDLTSTYNKKGLILSGIHNCSPFELNQIIDSRKYRMPQTDRTYGISYFKPQRMANQADLYFHLKSQKQGVQLTKQPTLEMIQNTFNAKLPLDLKYQSDINSMKQSPTFLKQTESSHNKYIYKHQILSNNNNSSNNGVLSPINSPLIKAFDESNSFTIQTDFLSNTQQQGNNSIFKQQQILEHQQKQQQKINEQSQIINTALQQNIQIRNKGRSCFSLHLPKTNNNYNNNNNNNYNKNLPLIDISQIQSNRSTKISQTDRNLRKSSISPLNKLNISITSIKSKDNNNNKSGIRSPLNIFSSNIEIDSFNTYSQPQFYKKQNQDKISMDNLIHRCNETLIESVEVQKQINLDKNNVSQSASLLTKRIDRQEKLILSS